MTLHSAFAGQFLAARPGPSRYDERIVSELIWSAYLSNSREELLAKNDAYLARLGLQLGMRYDWDFREASIVWSRNEKALARASIVVIGTLAEGKFLWSWADEDIPPTATKGIEKVRAFGELHGIRRLCEEEWPAYPADADNMTAVSVRVLGARGHFRARVEDVSVYFALMRVHREGFLNKALSFFS